MECSVIDIGRMRPFLPVVAIDTRSPVLLSILAATAPCIFDDAEKNARLIPLPAGGSPGALTRHPAELVGSPLPVGVRYRSLTASGTSFRSVTCASSEQGHV